MQPGRQAREHLARQVRVDVERGVDGRFADPDQQGVFQRLRIGCLGPVQEHEGLAKVLARPEEFDHLVVSVRPGQHELDRADGDHVEAIGAITLAEGEIVSCNADVATLAGECRKVFGVEVCEQRRVLEQVANIEGLVHGVTGKKMR
jgi:hypothetical protein